MRFPSLVTTLVAASLSLCAAEVSLMFGPPNPAEKQDQFLDFQYKTPQDFPGLNASRTVAWCYNPHGGYAWQGQNGSLPPDNMSGHGFLACGKMEIPFPDGPAYVHAFIGDWIFGWKRIRGRDQDISIKTNGTTVFQQTISPENAFKEWCKLEDYTFSRHDDIWDRLVKPVFTEITFQTEARDGKIILDCNQVLLTALVIQSDKQQLDQSLARLEKERRNEFARRYPWKPAPDEPMPSTDDKDFLLFQRHPLETVYPWTRPAQHELSDCPKFFAARGEQEMLRFGILPLRDLKRLDLSIGDFKGPQGVISTAKQGHFWKERYKEQGSREQNGTIKAVWQLNPMSYVLQDYGVQDAEAGTPRMYVLDLDIPEDAAPGFYEAPLTISAEGKPLRRAKLLLRVLPFALDYKGAAVYNFQMGYCNFAAWCAGYNPETARKHTAGIAAFIRQYHFSNSYFYPWGYGIPGAFRLGKIKGELGSATLEITPEHEKAWDSFIHLLDPDRTMEFLSIQGFGLFLNLGWAGRNPFGDFKARKFDAKRAEKWEKELKDMERLCPQIDAFFRRKGYPRPVWYFTGELDNYGSAGVEQAVRMAKVLHNAGCETLVTINGPLAYKYTPEAFDHVWANPNSPVDEALRDAVLKAGHKFGAHNSGDTRFQAGFQFWRTGGEGRHQETIFYTDFLTPYSLLPWNYNTALVYPAPDGTYRPTLPFLNYRDGRDDYLYLHTLEKALDKADKNSNAYKDAQDLLQRLTAKIHFDPRLYHTEVFDGVEGTAAINEAEWNSVSIERYRWRIARAIMALEAEK